MSEQSCPACGEKTSGPYCSQCGTRVDGVVRCAACGNELPPGGKFCNQCGTPAGAAGPAVTTAAAAAGGKQAAATRESGRPASTLPWVVTGMALLALAIALVFPRAGGEPSDPAATAPATAPAGAPGTGFGDATSVDLSALTPRERADRLFNRVMQNVSSGDSAQASFFLPMAIAAYEDVPSLDADGHYHMAVLHLAGGDPAAARARADSILAATPTHLFGLFTAAQAEQALGNEQEARALYERFQRAFAAESALARTEYTEHQAVLPLMRDDAEKALQ